VAIFADCEGLAACRGRLEKSKATAKDAKSAKEEIRNRRGTQIDADELIPFFFSMLIRVHRRFPSDAFPWRSWRIWRFK
jgi:hypothetical protein